MSSNINIKTIDTTKERFFTYWLTFLKPYHKLANKEIELLAYILLLRHDLSKVIKDDSLVDIMLFERKTRVKMKERMGYSSHAVLNNSLRDLRIKMVLSKDNKILKSLIPNLDETNNNFRLIFNFNINEARHSAEEDS